MKVKLKNEIKVLVLLVVFSIVISVISVSAASSLSANDITYSNKTSGSSATTVQSALEDLYNKKYSSITTYAFGLPTASDPIDFKEVIDSSGSNVFVQKQGTQLSVCLYYHNQLFCMKAGTDNWETNQSMLNTTTFPGASCDTFSTPIRCSGDSFTCAAMTNGLVMCQDLVANLTCSLYADGTVNCS